MSSKRLFVTTSWDDGHPQDMKVADLLRTYNLQGTFYIPIKNQENNVMDSKCISEIARSFEVGGHTLSHKYLTTLKLPEIEHEIFSGKSTLEEIIGKELLMFAFPGGKYTNQIINIVKEAGFIGARNISMLNFSTPSSPFEMDTTYILGKITNYTLLKHIIKRRNFPALPIYIKLYKYNHSLVEYTCRLFDLFLSKKETSIFHIWGHSWELDKFNIWNEMESIFKYISNRPDVEYVTNSKILFLK